MILLALAGKILAPKTPEEGEDAGKSGVRVSEKPRKKFKKMASAQEALAAMGPLK